MDSSKEIGFFGDREKHFSSHSSDLDNSIQQDTVFTSSPLQVLAGSGKNTRQWTNEKQCISQWTNEKYNGPIANTDPSKAIGFTDQEIQIRQDTMSSISCQHLLMKATQGLLPHMDIMCTTFQQDYLATKNNQPADNHYAVIDPCVVCYCTTR